MAKLVKSKLVLVDVPEEKRGAVINVLRTELGLDVKDAERILNRLPKELLSSVPFEAAELIASSLKKAGANAEVVAESGRFCELHPHKLAKARCKKCEKYICEIEILAAKKKLLCPDCYEKLLFRNRLMVILGILVIVIASIAYVTIKPWIKKAFKALGPAHTYTVAFVCFANGTDPQRLEVFNTIGMPNVADPQESLYAIPKFFANEFARYTGVKRQIIKGDILGVFMIDPNSPPPPGLNKGELKSYLEKMLLAENVSPNDYDLFVFVFLCKHKDLLSDSYHDLVSVVDKYAISYFPTDRPNERGLYLASTAWAVAQLLGAKPKSLSSPEEIPEDILRLVNPRSKVETFGNIAYGLKLQYPSKLVHITSLSEARIGYQTAYELGWTSKSILNEHKRESQ